MANHIVQDSLDFGAAETSGQDLCLDLLRSDSEQDVVGLLKAAGYWDNETAWLPYGDNENNFSTIGNQQASPDAALVEKLINSVDAMLMRESWRAGIDPSGPDAPPNIKHALQQFFGIPRGNLTELEKGERRTLADNIALIATGTAQIPSYTIVDRGEGQTPARMPETLLSLGRSNKLRIPFVQGKFNMGSTGALQFCSLEHNFELIISRRDPQIADRSDQTWPLWSFTVLRRVEPTGAVRSSTYRYLAPGGALPTFGADSIPALPGDFPEVYKKPLEHGTVVKLYEYQMRSGLRSDIRRDLYDRLSALLPEVALPVRLYERRRTYHGKTMESTLAGLSVRLEEDAGNAIEDGFPASAKLRVRGQEIRLKVYVFKAGQNQDYAKRDGVIFVVQGQAHGALDKSFFARQKVGMNYLEDSLLVLADCSDFDARSREDLFMNSRDRLRDSALKHEIEEGLTQIISEHPGLRALRDQRRQQEIEGRIGNSKPLADVLSDVIKHSPVLSKLLLQGQRLNNPFGLIDVADGPIYKGVRFPTFFEPVKEFTEHKPKHAPCGHRFRVAFKTDAVNDYFDRDVDPGTATLLLKDGTEVEDFTLNLWNGRASLTVSLPDDAEARVGELIAYHLVVEDSSRITPLESTTVVVLGAPEEGHVGGEGERKAPSGANGTGNKDQEKLELPHIIDVRIGDWERYHMTRESAIRIKSAAEKGFDFYVNLDNVHLRSEIKGQPGLEPEVLESQYRFGMVLVGLALLRELNKDDEEESKTCLRTHQQVEAVCDALSPFLVPMVTELGALTNQS